MIEYLTELGEWVELTTHEIAHVCDKNHLVISLLEGLTEETNPKTEHTVSVKNFTDLVNANAGQCALRLHGDTVMVCSVNKIGYLKNGRHSVEFHAVTLVGAS